MQYHKIISKISALEDELFKNNLLNPNTERHLIGLLKYIKKEHKNSFKSQ